MANNGIGVNEGDNIVVGIISTTRIPSKIDDQVFDSIELCLMSRNQGV